ncbi:RsmB/NOP family class I SAM-dependent RNA methyltransferase [Lacrimispora sp. BS-2]|uniref:RsmB/NOP family class I SAM-dependent RNA methyltransferase n=1 Tax=Lacrimispora sp. BS-2 TaxID=3151850 RepID=A0AAU7PT16_9FIRM
MKERKISEEFLNRMKNLLGEEEYEAYLRSFDEERLYGLRVNTLKITPEEFTKMTTLKLEPVPWIHNGFYYEGDERPAKDPYYYAGLYYLQEPSAMTPASLLPVVPGDKVLDLCAAPGGKSTELGAKLKGKGLLVSNDISNSRAKALLKNLELWGIENICVTSEEPKKLKETFGGFFDKVLVDAPCSGEGMFRKDADMVKSYEEHGPEYYAAIQREIMDQAVDMLAPGGLLLYSTCTFSVCENEDIISKTLDCHEEMELIKLPLFEGAKGGIGLTGCLRLFPHKIRGEGHFMAMLQKKDRPERYETFGKAGSKQLPLPDGLSDFLSMVSKPLERSRIRIKNDMVYYLPEHFPDNNNGLRYLRTGLFLGEMKKGRFEPGQAFAMALKPEEFKQAISWEKQDERVIRYLKGETISLKDGEEPIKGWCLVCVEGFPLGFAKGGGGTLKNKYYPGWRWQ